MQEVVRVQGEHERLLHIQRVVKELPSPHFRWTSGFVPLSSMILFYQKSLNKCFVDSPQDSEVPH